MRKLLSDVADRANRYVEGVAERSVAPSSEAVVPDVSSSFHQPTRLGSLPESVVADSVIDHPPAL